MPRRRWSWRRAFWQNNHIKLSFPPPDDSLTYVGLLSLDLVNLMVAVEAEFDIMIPPAYLMLETFRSISSIARMIEVVRGGA